MDKKDFIQKWGKSTEVKNGRTVDVDNSHSMLHDLNNLPVETKIIKEECNCDDKQSITKEIIRRFSFYEFIVIIFFMILVAGEPDLLDTIIGWMRSIYEK